VSCSYFKRSNCCILTVSISISSLLHSMLLHSMLSSPPFSFTMLKKCPHYSSSLPLLSSLLFFLSSILSLFSSLFSSPLLSSPLRSYFLLLIFSPSPLSVLLYLSLSNSQEFLSLSFTLFLLLKISFRRRIPTNGRQIASIRIRHSSAVCGARS
jgi:hypothetical protein